MLKKLLFTALAALFCFSFFGKDVLAQDGSPAADKKQPENVIIGKDEVVEHDLFVGGSTVIISGVINGDVFAGANNLVIDGVVNGDLIAGTNTITVSGEVTGDVRAGGNSIFLNGIVGKNVTIFGNSLTIGSEAQIAGSVLAGGQLVNLNGPVLKDITVYAQEVNFASSIGRNFKGSFQKANFNEGTKILGNFDYQASQEIEIKEGMIVGETSYQPLKEKSFISKKGFFKNMGAMPFLGMIGASLYLKFVAFLLALGFGFLFLYFFPKRVEGMVKIISCCPWKNLGIGVLTPIIFSLMVVFLAVSLIGIPFIFIVFPIFLLLLYFAKIFTAFFVGRKILGVKKSWGWALLVGLLIYYLLSLIWVINGIAAFFFIFIGLGAFILDQKYRRQGTVKFSAKKR
ncbi:polymer-forming cytoskeletal protein [Patescibacteria group bacterium]|nr:polymer-forming cytoskeletal protein [Patescibacteria group bacterium]